MASRPRSSWPVVLLVGLGLALVIGAAAAVAAPSEGGRPWWHSNEVERITGTVIDIDREQGVLGLEGLVAYEPVRAGLGTLDVEVTDGTALRPDASAWPSLHVGDTVDLEVRRDAGRWVAESLTVLDPN